MAAFVDANVAIYAAGGDHPYRIVSERVLDLSARSIGSCVSSAEVMQELLNVGLRRNDIARAVRLVTRFDAALHGNMASILREDVLAAASMNVPPRLQARDRLHLAVMARLEVTDMISADRAFDGVDGVRRLDPLLLDTWRNEVFPGPAARQRG